MPAETPVLTLLVDTHGLDLDWYDRLVKECAARVSNTCTFEVMKVTHTGRGTPDILIRSSDGCDVLGIELKLTVGDAAAIWGGGQGGVHASEQLEGLRECCLSFYAFRMGPNQLITAVIAGHFMRNFAPGSLAEEQWARSAVLGRKHSTGIPHEFLGNDPDFTKNLLSEIAAVYKKNKSKF